MSMLKKRKSTLIAVAFLLCSLNVLLYNANKWTLEPISRRKPNLDSSSSSSSVKTSSPPGCSSKSNVVFINTHECLNSSVTIMFQRFGLTHGLNFVLPNGEPSLHIGNPMPFRWTMVQPLARPDLTYNMLVHHVIYDRKEIAKHMPNDTIYVTILRKPSVLFESMYRRCRLQDVFKMPLEQFLQDTQSTSSLINRRVLAGRVGFNQMSFNLGLYPGFSSKMSNVQETLKGLETDFHLVMTAEKLDSSLLLLKRLLCWDVADIAAFHVDEPTVSPTLPLSPEAASNLTSFNGFDESLYSHFSRVLDARLEEVGSAQLKSDWEHLEQARHVIMEACSSYKVPKVQGRLMDGNTCEYLRLSESEMAVLMHQHQALRMRRFHL